MGPLITLVTDSIFIDKEERLSGKIGAKYSRKAGNLERPYGESVYFHYDSDGAYMGWSCLFDNINEGGLPVDTIPCTDYTLKQLDIRKAREYTGVCSQCDEQNGHKADCRTLDWDILGQTGG